MILKIKIEFRFLLEHRLGLIRPNDIYSISKWLIKKNLPKEPVIIDCGAHIGRDSIDLSRVMPRAQIHSFEAAPDVFAKLESNTSKYKNIRCYPIALSNKSGDADFYLSSGNSDGSSSLLEPTGHLENHPNVFFEKNIKVKTLTLDDWALEQNIMFVDLLWLDMQGFELPMLQASKEILKNVKIIHAEVSLKETYKGVETYPVFRKWLESKGFQVIKEALPSGTDMGNVLFIRK